MAQDKSIQLANVVQNLDLSVQSVITANTAIGFAKAYQIATATKQLKELLNQEYMAPIMDMQNNKLGFKTDRPNGYDMPAVKNCLIEAVLTGVQPYGNQFNIIAGNCYITKEGFGYLLKNQPGLSYEIIPGIPRINADKTSAAIVMKICWSINGERQEREIDFPIRMNAAMGVDAVIGKATRKARAWLYNTLNDCEIADGDVLDVDAKVVSTEPRLDPKLTRWIKLINACATLDELHAQYEDGMPVEVEQAYNAKLAELNAKG